MTGTPKKSSTGQAPQGGNLASTPVLNLSDFLFEPPPVMPGTGIIVINTQEQPGTEVTVPQGTAAGANNHNNQPGPGNS